jgi:hypothetical protein
MQRFFSYRKSIWPILLLPCLFFSSCKYVDPCYSKDAFIAHLDESVNEVKEKGNTYTSDDWAVMDKKVEKIMDDCYEKYKDELTSKEKEKIGILAITYVYERQKDNMKDFVGTIENMELDRKAMEFLDQADDQIVNIFNEVLKDDLKNVVDTALDEFEKLAKELKEKWEKNKNK